MGRKRKLCRGLLTPGITAVLCLLEVSGCTGSLGSACAPTDIILCADGPGTRTAEPAQDLITDANIFVFSSDGFLERAEYLKGTVCALPLVHGRDYDVYACVNFGYKLSLKTLEELKALEFHLAYPDDYSTGVPMCGKACGVRAGKSIRLPLKRMMSEIRLCVDRSRLDGKTEMDVRSVRIGNCPKKCRAFSESGAERAEDCFSVGFGRGSSECAVLNRSREDGKSPEISLFMLENMHGAFPGEVREDSDKVLDRTSQLADVCSYIEMELDYLSPEHYSAGGYLKYRFYLGESRDDLNVVRNCRYHITVTPEGDGLRDGGWRVDKTFMHDVVRFSMKPDGLIEASPGDIIHVRCSFHPAGAPFRIGLDELEDAREKGVLDYEIDADWHGVTVTAKGYGTGKVYMEAGAPINQAGLLNISVRQS